MSVVGIENVVSRFKLTLEQIQGEKTEGAITEMLIIGGFNAHSLTPIDSNFLYNSQGRETAATPTGWTGALYYGAKYAGWVNKMSGKLKGKPRQDFGVTSNRSEFGPQKPKAFGGGTHMGNYWDPAAEPHFLEKGMQQMAKENAEAIFKKHYQV